MPPKRKRDDVTGSWLAAKLKPFVAAGGKSWLRYDHHANVKKAKRCKTKIESSLPWIKALEGHTSLNKSVVQDAMGILVEAHKKSGRWKQSTALIGWRL